MAHAGGDVPVDGADVVAGLIFAHFLEGDAGALEDGVIFAAEQILDGAARRELQAADLADDFAEACSFRLSRDRKGAAWSPAPLRSRLGFRRLSPRREPGGAAHFLLDAQQLIVLRQPFAAHHGADLDLPRAAWPRPDRRACCPPSRRCAPR